MKLFLKYIKQRRRVIIAFGVFSLLFIVSFALYHLPMKAVIYPILLCVLFALIFAIFDFRRIRKKHDMLKSINGIIEIANREFPSADGVEDEDYQKIIRLLSAEYNDLSCVTSKRYSDTVDYYTVWAHQIKTPIASMKLTLQNEDSAMARKLSAELFRIEQYVEMVLTFLRLDSESTDYLFREYDLDTIIKQAVKKFSGEFIGRKISLKFEPTCKRIVTDEKWLSFVIEQVLSNALKYTRAGSITIFLDKEDMLHISDTGIGIAPEDLPRIFENGFTGYNGRSDKKASGIGLYLCKRVCNNLGHKITAESVVDVGTTIFIDLSQTKAQVE